MGCGQRKHIVEIAEGITEFVVRVRAGAHP
jgi:hypothetical protein